MILPPLRSSPLRQPWPPLPPRAYCRPYATTSFDAPLSPQSAACSYSFAGCALADAAAFRLSPAGWRSTFTPEAQQDGRFLPTLSASLTARQHLQLHLSALPMIRLHAYRGLPAFDGAGGHHTFRLPFRQEEAEFPALIASPFPPVSAEIL